tara:strand:- start:1004 stop:1456 length:453 start_codon:yes stop_codon:yes gene_type:complete
MIAEISLVVGALKTLNAGIKTVKESGNHLSDIAGIFSTLTESKQAVEKIEHEAKEGTHVLSQEEALELAWAKNEIREREKELKKITPREVWRDMLSIQHKSLMEYKTKIAKEKKAIAKKKQALSSIVEGVFFWTLLASIAFGALYYFGVL